MLTASGPKITSYTPGSISWGFWDSFAIEYASWPTFSPSIFSNVLWPKCDDPDDVSDLNIPSRKALVAVSLELRPFVFQTKTFETFEEQ